MQRNRCHPSGYILRATFPRAFAYREPATVHAHLPEFEPPDDESVVHMERPHSHADARSIDLLTTTAAQVVHFDATLVTVYAIADVPLPCCGFFPIAMPRAHGPPTLEFQIPPAPPA